MIVRNLKLLGNNLYMLYKEELEKLLKLDGQIKGVFLQTDAKYILEKEGEGGLQRLEKKAKEFGLKLDYRTARAMQWYPVGLRPISLLLIKEVFGYNDKDIREMGRMAAKFSFIIKFFVRFFTSIKKIFEKSPDYYKMQYSIGKLEPVYFDEKEKKCILRLKNFKIHPLVCFYLEGYFQGVAEFALKGKVSCQETKCVFRGDEYNEYLIQW